MEPVPTARQRGQRTWTDAQRAEQSRRLKSRKIWQHSTGPRTAHGKSISCLNALTHGTTSRPAKAFMAHFKNYRAFLRSLWAKRAELIAKQKNELIDRRPTFASNNVEYTSFTYGQSLHKPFERTKNTPVHKRQQV